MQLYLDEGVQSDIGKVFWNFKTQLLKDTHYIDKIHDLLADFEDAAMTLY